MSIRIICGLVALSALSACITVPVDEAAGLDDSFEARVGLYDEDVLLERRVDLATGEAIIVGSNGCEVSDELRDEFDALVPLSDAAQQESETRHAKFGFPVDTIGGDIDVLLHHDRYVIGYNSQLRVPVVASYFLREEDVVKGERKECFREDHRLEEADRSRLIDYDFQLTGFDRGHLVPDADLQTSEADAINSYFMSNMSPQHHSFNRGAWRLLEAAVRLWADERNDVHVISGAIFDRDEDGERDSETDAQRAPPTRSVAVATGFYKIVLDEQEDGNFDAISFILPHTFESTAPNVDYITENIASIDEIEALTGYDFFVDLDDTVEGALEQRKQDDLWCRRRC